MRTPSCESRDCGNRRTSVRQGEEQLSWLLTSTIDWFVGGALTFVLTTFIVYRLVTRFAGWGPRDT